MRYLGQGHEVDVSIPTGPLGVNSLDAITAAFEAAYRLLYSRTPQGVPLEALNWRAVVWARLRTAWAVPRQRRLRKAARREPPARWR